MDFPHNPRIWKELEEGGKEEEEEMDPAGGDHRLPILDCGIGIEW
ncbi:hypothetical protein GCM10010297_68900 [Streptomyces malachitofuscus]|nr:hypothetical protein GCM10010233_65450 [Streptomyces gancidicus]GGX39464.1 hypothetical protein GCM10010297_68900 [Streptomyces malachitofuscus]